MANLGETLQSESLSCYLIKRVRTITIYILYKYTGLVKLYDKCQRLYEQQTEAGYLALLSQACESKHKFPQYCLSF